MNGWFGNIRCIAENSPPQVRSFSAQAKAASAKGIRVRDLILDCHIYAAAVRTAGSDAELQHHIHRQCSTIRAASARSKSLTLPLWALSLNLPKTLRASFRPVSQRPSIR
ncbi:hypothetical protein PGA1_c19530 [Phaeobacter inhibens DSM 17395]|nr:hypothetical protein PGA1_c19530 [Phaeobacter inhibens DSM 17395]